MQGTANYFVSMLDADLMMEMVGMPQYDEDDDNKDEEGDDANGDDDIGFLIHGTSNSIVCPGSGIWIAQQTLDNTRLRTIANFSQASSCTWALFGQTSKYSKVAQIFSYMASLWIVQLCRYQEKLIISTSISISTSIALMLISIKSTLLCSECRLSDFWVTDLISISIIIFFDHH